MIDDSADTLVSYKYLVAKGYVSNRTTLSRWIADPRVAFPKPIPLGPNTLKWKLSDLHAFRDRRAQATAA